MLKRLGAEVISVHLVNTLERQAGSWYLTLTDEFEGGRCGKAGLSSHVVEDPGFRTGQVRTARHRLEAIPAPAPEKKGARSKLISTVLRQESVLGTSL